MNTERWLGPKQIAAQYNVSTQTARRWIKRIMGDDDAHMTAEKQRERKKRPHRIRRVPESLLEERIGELLNG